jgi:hypothetical protein
MKFQNGRNTALAVDLATLVTGMRAPHSKLKYLEYATNFAHVNSKSTIRVSRAVIVNKIVFKPWQVPWQNLDTRSFRDTCGLCKMEPPHILILWWGLI